MKSTYTRLISLRFWKLLLIAFSILIVQSNVFGQLATYPMATGGTNPTAGTALAAATSPNVTAGPMLYGSHFGNSHNGSGYRVKQDGTSDPWPTVPTDGFYFDIPLSPKPGFDYTISGITANINNTANTPTLIIQPFFQMDGTGPWIQLAPGQNIIAGTTAINFGAINEQFYNTHTYVIRFYVFGLPASPKNQEFRLRDLVFNGTTSAASVAPVVVTSTATTSVVTPQYAGNATGTYSFGPTFYLALEKGMVWSTSPNPTVALSTRSNNGVAGVINTNITGLAAGTTYYVRAYVITRLGVIYGAQLSFTTAPPSIPTITTDPVTNIRSNKVTCGGSAIDSGGQVITEKGLVWSTSSSPLSVTQYVGGNKLIYPSGGSLSFSELVKQLLPNTTYYIRAYAINSIGVGYGAVIQFTTSAPVPVLTAIPGIIDLGENLYNANPIVINYMLTGNYLLPASGNITITAPAPFLISLTGAAGSFVSSISLPYTNSKINSTPIYVELPTNTYGTFSGNINHSGGSVGAGDADIVALTGTIVQSPDDVTNLGTDFWLGFGYQEKMSKKATDPGEAKLSVYISAGDQPANVVVETPGLAAGWAPAFPRIITVPANTIVEVTDFPTGDVGDAKNPGGLPDTRLYYTGVSNRGIHVYTTNGAPVAVWMYTYANNNSAAGSMVFPTSTWNSSYTVQAYGGKSNVGGAPNSFFYVIANEDNTKVIFKPSQAIIDSSSTTIFTDGHVATDIKYQVNGNYGNEDTVTLNKGQVFNAMGFVQGSGSNSALGLDLSGSTVRTTCDKKIAVFAGNGRCLVTTPTVCTAPSSGSDNLVQQMIPKVAWGTKYFTVPTKTMETNLYRIYVQDPSTTTTLWINDPSHLSPISVNTLYYLKETNQPMLVESDKPISVTQFIIAGGCSSSGSANTNGLNGFGDPEMIILSAAQQAINKVAVYSPNFKNSPTSSGSYINVVIKSGGVSSFKLDVLTNPTQMVDTGSSSYTANAYGSATLIPIANAFKTFVADPAYSWAKFKVTTGTTHRLSSDSGFNAIAYGMGGGESYGFNAGTAIRNLNSVKFAQNPNGTDSSASAVRTCIGNPVTLKIALPYPPQFVDSLVWYPENITDPRINASGRGRNKGAIDIVTGKAKYVSTFIVDGRTFYVYESPIQYQFNTLGTFKIIANAYGTFASDCPGEDPQKITVIVGRDNVNFTYAALCGSPTVQFTNNTLAMAGSSISQLTWSFGDGITSNSTVNPISHTYPLGGNTLFNVKLSTINSYGCNTSDSVLVDISGGIRPKFTIAPKDTVCTGATVTFDPSTSQVTGSTTGNPVKWTWNFGTGPNVVVNGASSPNQTFTYNTAGLYTVSLTLETSNGCQGVFKDTVIVEATPVAAINPNPTFVCLGDSAAYSDASTISIGAIASWLWSFDDGGTSTLKNPKHLWLTAGSHTVTLAVQSAGGCAAATTASHTINVNPLPTAGFSFSLNCTTRTINFTDTSNGNGGVVNGWNWRFGDGPIEGTSTLQNPSYTYAAAGTYTITLIVKTANGCNSIAITKTITIAASPVADFTIPGTTCLPSASPVFANNTTISDGTIATVTYVWNFGDGTGDLSSPPLPLNPTHVFPGTGPYNVKLTAISINGCSHSVTKSYSSIYAAPVAVISPLTEVCVNGTANFSSTSSTAAGSSVTGWLWNFGDGTTTSSLQNPTHIYTSSGIKTVTLTVTSAAGCSSAAVTGSITVNALPVAGFTDTINCTTRSVGFTDTSVPNSGTVTQWNWTFGDVTNNTSTLQNPTHVYPNSGTYTVTLSVTNSKGCTSTTTFTSSVIIAARPVADFTIPGTTCLPSASPVFTNNTAISDGTIATVTYVWNFGDASGDLSSPPLPLNPTHVFPGTGPYNVKLTAISNNGCSHSVIKSYSTLYAAPVAVISPLAEVCVNGTANFSSTSSTAAGSSVTGWLWNFGDGTTTSSLQNPTHIYTSSGIKTVTLTVTSAAGCSSAAVTGSITVNALPVAGFTDTINCTTRSVGFTDTSVPNSGTVTQWNWTFGDVTNNTSTLQNPTHVYPNSGTYTVTLSVTNSKGCTSTTTFTSSVVIAARPVADFTLPGNTCLPNATALFTNTSSISDGTIGTVSYTWDFGDNSGIIASPPNPVSPTHTYAATGSFTVTLKATSANGCIHSVSKSYNKIFAEPVAVITAPPGGVCLGNSAGFSSTSSTAAGSTVTGWSWTFGDVSNNTSTLQNPSHTYPSGGSKSVTLVVTSAVGCSSTVTNQNINVNLSPIAGFTYSAIRCKDSVISFNDASVSNATGITEWKWTFGDAGTLTQTSLATATHKYLNAQSYTATLEVKNSNGCVSSTPYSRTVVINPNPVSDFSVGNICIPTGLAQFTQNASISSGLVTNWLWDFAQAGSAPSSLQNPSYNYTTGGEYFVKLKVTSDSSCSATKTISVKAFNTPAVSFSVNAPNNLCSNLPVTLVNQSTLTGYGNVDKFELYWDYLNNPSVKSTINAPTANSVHSQQYPLFGSPASKTYRVLIKAFSGVGCSKEYFEDIVVNAAPQIQFTQPLPICQEAAPIVLTGATEINGLAGAGIYIGNGVSPSPSFNPSTAGAGTHTIRYLFTTNKGCIGFAEKNIVVNPTPTINFGAATINVLEGDQLKLTPTISNGGTYLWTPPTYLNSATVANPMGYPTADIVYQLKVTSIKTCVANSSISIKVVKKYIIPNTFTPNNDQIHDRWEIENLKLYPDVRVRIFNRSGQLVFESIGYNTPWDGTYKGKEMPFGTYYYIIETGGGRGPRTGYVTIIR